MENQFSPLSFCCFDQEEEIGELRQALMYTTWELETAIITAKEETARQELELINLKDVLSKTIKERDEAKAKCQRLTLEKLGLEQRLQRKQQDSAPLSAGISNSIEDNDSKASKNIAAMNTVKNKQSSLIEEQDSKLEGKKPLPEKGNLLKAVMEAGPLLQILLLAGQLPEWQHPPPQLHSIEIPPIAISSPTTSFLRQESSKSLTSGDSSSKKRAMEFCESPSSKLQKIADVLR